MGTNTSNVLIEVLTFMKNIFKPIMFTMVILIDNDLFSIIQHSFWVITNALDQCNGSLSAECVYVGDVSLQT